MTARRINEARFNGAIARAMTELHSQDPKSEEYAKILDQVVKLHKMKEAEAPSRVSRDTLALIAANLTGIILVMSYEHTHVITTKALSFAVKPR